jgi:hypothetical protein
VAQPAETAIAPLLLKARLIQQVQYQAELVGMTVLFSKEHRNRRPILSVAKLYGMPVCDAKKMFSLAAFTELKDLY